MSVTQHVKLLLLCSCCAPVLCLQGYTADQQVTRALHFTTDKIITNYQQIADLDEKKIPPVLGPLGIAIYGKLAVNSIPALAKLPEVQTLDELTQWVYIDADSKDQLQYLVAGITVMDLQAVNNKPAIIYGPLPERIVQLAGGEPRLPLEIPAGTNGNISFQKLNNGNTVLALSQAN